jgi:hypothetical protein
MMIVEERMMRGQWRKGKTKRSGHFSDMYV